MQEYKINETEIILLAIAIIGAGLSLGAFLIMRSLIVGASRMQSQNNLGSLESSVIEHNRVLKERADRAVEETQHIESIIDAGSESSLLIPYQNQTDETSLALTDKPSATRSGWNWGIFSFFSRKEEPRREKIMNLIAENKILSQQVSDEAMLQQSALNDKLEEELRKLQEKVEKTTQTINALASSSGLQPRSKGPLN